VLGRETASGQTGGIEIASREAPEDRSAVPACETRKEAGGEGGGDGAILLVLPRPPHLVQRAQRKPTAGERRIDRRQLERHDTPTNTSLLEHPDALA